MNRLTNPGELSERQIFQICLPPLALNVYQKGGKGQACGIQRNRVR